MNISTESKRLTTEEFLEANRIARELVTLHKAGILTGADIADDRAVIMAGALRIFAGKIEVIEPTHPLPR